MSMPCLEMSSGPGYAERWTCSFHDMLELRFQSWIPDYLPLPRSEVARAFVAVSAALIERPRVDQQC